MNKKLMWILIIILIILVGFFGIKYINADFRVAKTLQDKINDCQKDYQEGGINYPNPDCITKLAIEYQNRSVCNILPSHGDNLSPYGKGYDCVVSLVASKGDIESCGVFRDPHECQRQVLVNKNSS